MSSPPRGRFSHIAMFRIGSLLFIPAYLSVILYRVFASSDDDGNPVLMAALAISTAVRFCGGTFVYTAVSVLLNYMSPLHVVGFASGIAQSTVSLARFIGPILGGTLWSMSAENGPAGYPVGFIACSGVCALAVALSFLIKCCHNMLKIKLAESYEQPASAINTLRGRANFEQSQTSAPCLRVWRGSPLAENPVSAEHENGFRGRKTPILKVVRRQIWCQDDLRAERGGLPSVHPPAAARLPPRREEQLAAKSSFDVDFPRNLAGLGIAFGR
ncbi:uncharacterized protein B0H18DRAFT_959629 [Fomitopsis serialis]|uniref:uncharacterized protein n=1 Tax=Fomitopsis serialis TaxID=139415 RepID=UPI0020084C6B|nr:uncharacterized protein B0H18DRAFT_959629 [Neoantrodia serialis]KAH9914809.1 hypothetical protein B0H18DRAFT_959629 [Neoantrodia serialis]